MPSSISKSAGHHPENGLLCQRYKEESNNSLICYLAEHQGQQVASKVLSKSVKQNNDKKDQDNVGKKSMMKSLSRKMGQEAVFPLLVISKTVVEKSFNH